MTLGWKRQRGLTLVELMVATTLSLVLLGGVLLVFSANKTTYQMQTGLGTLQENGRYAMRQIVSDLQMAGYGGCLSPHLNPKPRVINLVSTPPAYLDDFAAGEFFSGSDSGGSFGGRSAEANTDSIEIRGPLRSNVTFVAGEFAVNAPVEVLGAASGFASNEFLLISDCAGADIFRASNVTAPNLSGNTDITHISPQNTQTALSRPFGADSVVMGFATHTYFVSDTNRNNSAGQDIFGLYRFDGTAAVELVDGVEDLQIDYALDTVGNGEIDTFKSASAMSAGEWSEIMAIRIALLMNSVEGASAVTAPYTFFPAQSTPINPGANDRLLRQEFSALVAVRNAVQ